MRIEGLRSNKNVIIQLLFFRLLAFAVVVASFSWIACNNNQPANDNRQTDNEKTNSGAQHATATLNGTKPDTTVIGTVRFYETGGGKVGMQLQITVPKKANQSVAVHIHEHGDCGNMGKHAGGHWNPTRQNHGKWGSGSFHSGDIGNIPLDANGRGLLQLETGLWSIGGDAQSNILNKTIIVHSGVDDYTSQPSGNSGERIGCGVIRNTNQ
ncbi:MAG: superoxide dismutase family protein [Flavisolibacter sp.]|nr:superoxide dismutase family protein [Flavisolibacter sp.]